MKKKKSLGDEIVASLKEAVDWSKGKIDLKTEYLELPADPPVMDGKHVRRIREKLRVSQPVFAKYLGVSDRAVKSWEQDISQPNGSAIRLLQIASEMPEEFRGLIVRVAKKGA